ncbi:aconitase X [Jannaschia sp. LMIT008]|uniref:cis-3-hydroxy-L-proline dehydratase n=1 Tax=Jannaschia maritima TaxID=3032585 RepID=UPI0028114862|nr:aconitase X [Jannaschia sp. LMIT008]
MPRGDGAGGLLVHRPPVFADAPVLACAEGISFWGGVDPETGTVIDTHHPQRGASVAGTVLAMPTSRGSCTGSAVLLSLALSGLAPRLLVFCEDEDVLTLGALVAGLLFDRAVGVARLRADAYDRVAASGRAGFDGSALVADGHRIALGEGGGDGPALSDADRRTLAGDDGPAPRIAMETVVAMARVQGAARLIDVTRVHIDGCIYANDGNLTFARAMRDQGARVRVPTTTNAISVDRARWRRQGVAPAFGTPAQELADAYVAMGAAPTFTCAPYLLADRPARGERIAWAESNAVVFANTVLGARTPKHPDFLDLMIAVTGRAPEAGAYLDEGRAPVAALDVALPEVVDDGTWPMLGWLAGRASPAGIPLLRGLERAGPSHDDLKALCAAFGTTSAAPMLHVAGVTPEADAWSGACLPAIRIGPEDLDAARDGFAAPGARVDLVALGSPHLSADECRRFADLLDGRRVADGVDVVLTLGAAVRAEIAACGTLARLEGAGAVVVSDCCWCSIARPLFPPGAKVVMTNSGKYAHYGPGLTGCTTVFGSLADCARAATRGRV